MADFVIKANDRRPSIQATLSFANATGAQLTALGTDLGTATVSFIMRKVGAMAPKINSPAVVVDAANRVVRYDWAVSDTDTPGTYQAEWEVHFADNKTQTFPTMTYHTIDVLADLDEAT